MGKVLEEGKIKAAVASLYPLSHLAMICAVFRGLQLQRPPVAAPGWCLVL